MYEFILMYFIIGELVFLYDTLNVIVKSGGMAVLLKHSLGYALAIAFIFVCIWPYFMWIYFFPDSK